MNDITSPPQALVAQIEPERSEDETQRLLHAFPSPQHPGDRDETYATEFLAFFQKIFIMLSGL